MQRLIRLYYALITIRDYADRLNRWSDIEGTLRTIGAGLRPPLTPAESKAMAEKLGIPSWVYRHHRKPCQKNTPPPSPNTPPASSV